LLEKIGFSIQRAKVMFFFELAKNKIVRTDNIKQIIKNDSAKTLISYFSNIETGFSDINSSKTSFPQSQKSGLVLYSCPQSQHLNIFIT
jgi:hypothetical protein